MAAALVQTSSAGVGGYPSASTSFSSTPTVGNVVFVTGFWNPTFGTEPTGISISDNQGNTYSAVVRSAVTQENGVFIGYCVIGTASGTFTVTATVTGGSADAGVALCLQEWSGMDTASLLDQSGSGTQFVNSSFSVSASGANSGADRVVFAGVSGRGSDITPTNNPPNTGYTNVFARLTGSFGEPRGLASYKVVSASETSSADWSTISSGSGGSLAMVIATFAVASGSDPNAAQAETITFSDAQTGVAKFIGASAESITFADTQAATADFISAQSETITLSDSQLAASNSDAAQAETLTLSDSQVATGGSGAQQAETLTLSDSSVAVQASANAQAETITLSDSAVAVAAFDGAQDESITLFDEQDATEPSDSAQEETITFVDSQVAVQDSACAQGESITFEDVVTTPSSAGGNLTQASPGLIPKIWPGLTVRYEGKPKRVQQLDEEERERLEEIAEQAVIEAANEKTKKAMKASLQASMRAAEIELAAASYIKLVEQAALLRMEQIEEEEIAVALILM